MKVIEPRSFYFRIVSGYLENLLAEHAAEQGVENEAILGQIRGYAEHTARDHGKPQNDLSYNESLARAAYVYKHVPARAYLFEKVLNESRLLRKTLKESEKEALRVVAIGGGPGADLLGLLRQIGSKPRQAPSRIEFAIFDANARWGEEWGELSERALTELSGYYGVDVDVTPSFYATDVFDPSDYNEYRRNLKKVDIVVFNHLLTENDVSSDDLADVIEHLVDRTPKKCAFVFIDSLEQNASFRSGIKRVLAGRGFTSLEGGDIVGQMDGRELVAEFFNNYMAESKLGMPRTGFYTSTQSPSVGWVVANRA